MRLDRHVPVTSAMRWGRSAQLGPLAKWTRNSWLPSGPRIGEAITSRVPSPSVAACVVTRSRTSLWTSRVSDDAAVRAALAGLELGLDEGDDRCDGRQGR